MHDLVLINVLCLLVHESTRFLAKRAVFLSFLSNSQ